MFENPRRGRQARNFTKNVPKILDLDQIVFRRNIFRKLTLGAPAVCGSCFSESVVKSCILLQKPENDS